MSDALQEYAEIEEQAQEEIENKDILVQEIYYDTRYFEKTYL